MSALQFLNKKSWHTSTIKNNEKVWLKEQEAAREKARIEELQKQLDEERKIEQIQKLEIESGRLDPAEVLKRRRLNWMYEYGPDKNLEVKKEVEEREREDIMLGKKEVDVGTLEKAKETQGSASAGLVDLEAKMREDPLVQIERERVKILGGVDPAKLEAEARLRRKEERRRIREGRKKRRELRGLKRQRTELYASELKREELHLRRSESAVPRDVELERDSLPLQREGASRHREREDLLRAEQRRPSAHRNNHGLMMPKGGTRVAVQNEFVPRSRPNTHEAREQPGKDFNSRRERHRAHMTYEERERKLVKMQREADRIDEERRRRADRYIVDREEEEEAAVRLQPGDDNDPGRNLARQAIAGASGADRIRQRRAWATRGDHASY